MADLLVTSTGEIFYKIDSQIAALLVSALPTVFERVNHQPAAPVSQEAQWFVGKNPFSGNFQLTFKQGAEEQFYVGPPEQAHRAFGRRKVPQAVIDQYAAALKVQQQTDLNHIRTSGF